MELVAAAIWSDDLHRILILVRLGSSLEALDKKKRLDWHTLVRQCHVMYDSAYQFGKDQLIEKLQGL